MPVPILNGLSELADAYDGFILDVWGVLYDGAEAFPAVIPCLRALRERGKRVVVLSNSPQRSRVIHRRFAKLGLAPEFFDGIHCSGEDVNWHLRHRTDPFYRSKGKKVLETGPNRFPDLLEGSDFTPVSNLGEADLILNSGPEDSEARLEAFEDFLREAVARSLPMTCANPDLEVIDKGRRQICAGALAARYEALGGVVRYHGKPHPEIYDGCVRELGGLPRDRILAVGDALRTDIRGANRAGIDGLLVAGGLMAAELGIVPGETPDPQRLEAVCAAEAMSPIAAVPLFAW